MKVCAISDLHGELPAVPPCDLLIVAGDICPDRPGNDALDIGSGPQLDAQRDWFLTRFLPWRQAQPAAHCLVTWGNHDYAGYLRIDPGPHTEIVVDDCVTVDGCRIWLTPWSSQYRSWAFTAHDHELTSIYARIPERIDILVSHQPAFGLCDTNSEGQVMGSLALAAAVERVQPRVLICGHIHHGHGHVIVPAEDGRRPMVAFNVAIMDEQYKPVYPPTTFDVITTEGPHA